MDQELANLVERIGVNPDDVTFTALRRYLAKDPCNGQKVQEAIYRLRGELRNRAMRVLAQRFS
jgi:hypothetical protein